MSRSPYSPGAGLTLEQTRAGQTISSLPAPGFRHPWQTRAAWNARAKQWVATVEPGFVNGLAPIYRATLREQKNLDPNWGINPLSGQPYFSADVFTKRTADAGSRTVDIPLYLSPAMPLSLRAIGTDGEPGSGVPEFFQKLGVTTAPPPVTAENFDTYVLPPRPAGSRLLRRCDFILHQPREALTSTVTFAPGPATGISNVTQTLGVRQPPASDPLRIFTGDYVARRPQTIDPLAGDYEEQTFDETLISTVFLLSPPDAEAGSSPDATWQPFVRHTEFWNLNYGQPAFRPLGGDPGVPLIPPLAGGAAQLIINFLTASLNDLTQQALNIIAGHSLAGRFWTPTGGGSDGTLPVDAVAVIASTTDKAARNAAKAREIAQQRRAERLDPPFPYRTQRFDLSLLSAA